jgi:hypothetical protein
MSKRVPVPASRGPPAANPAFLALGTIIVQSVLVSLTFPIGQLLTAAPLFYIDSPFHWYQMEVAKGLAAQGHLVGYDPYFGAGYLGGINVNASAKLPAALAVLFSPWLSSVVVYKLYVFAAAVLAPAAMPLAMHWLRLSRRAALAATAFALLVWWLSATRWYHTAGMVSFVFCSYLALPFAALATRYLTERTSRLAPLAVAIVGAIGIFIHPLFPVPAAFLVVALTIALWREVDLGKLAIVFVAVPILCVLPNLTWVVPTFRAHALSVLMAYPHQKLADISIVWNEALGRFTGSARGARVNTVLWFAVLWAWVAPLETRAKRVAVAVTIASFVLILFAALGAAHPIIAALQPNRLSVPAYLFLTVPAGLGLVATIELLFAQGFWRVASTGSAALFAATFAFFGWELERELSPADIPHHGAHPPEVRGVGEHSVRILEWLKNDTTPDARVLFETSNGRIHDGAHMAGYYALASGREFIGGPYPFNFFAGFWDGFLFGRRIDSFSEQELSHYLRLYNIGWIVAFSEPSKRVFDGMSGVNPLESHGPIKTYAVAGPRTFFLEGSGTVAARTFGRVELARLSGAAVVLKYHYVPGLRTVPAARLTPVFLPGDPTPFVHIADPPSNLVMTGP